MNVNFKSSCLSLTFPILVATPGLIGPSERVRIVQLILDDLEHKESGRLHNKKGVSFSSILLLVEGVFS